MPDVVVVGSANLDLVVRTSVRPQPGETVLGSHYEEIVGGKGLNQSIAAARLASSALVAALGRDAVADTVRGYAHRRGVDTSHVRTADAPTGRALITVTDDGENSIIVIAGANMELTGAQVVESLDALKPKAILIQREISEEATLTTIDWAQRHGARLVVNPSPANPQELPWFAAADPLIVNVHEARMFAGDEELSPETVARRLAERVRSALVTMGDKGVWVAEAGEASFVASIPVTCVEDTTGAGDEFAGAVAATLAHGGGLVEAAQAGAAAASRLVATPRAKR
ncbi:MAG: ribokinase [Actinomycetes bacterium]|nr:MAG: ribokinase [Actinomycetota bacterium]